MARPSENKYYESSDLTGLNQNLKRLLGMSGSVDRDRLSDLRTFSLLQGTEMDNRKKDALWNALQDSIGQEGLTFDQILMRNLGKSATDIQGGFTGEALLPSKKRKSALLQNLVRDKILKNFPHLKKKDVITASNGSNGPDIVLSKTARKLVGVNFECKNQNKMKTVYDWYKQSDKGSGKLTPAVVMKMNTRQPLVVIDLDDFFDLIK